MVDSGTFRTSSFLQDSKYVRRSGSDYLDRAAADGVASQEGSGATGDGSPRRHIDPTNDLERLDVCFGGFFPTVMRDMDETFDSLARMQAASRERRDAMEAARRIAASKRSEARVWTDEDGVAWTYRVLNDAEATIEGCECPDGVVALTIPETIEGMPVVSMEREACAKLAFAQSVAMPDGIVSIGECAFRDCPNLERIQYPANLERYDSSWTRGCSRLEEVVLPGMLPKVGSAVFDAPTLKRLTIGAGTSSIMPGAFMKSELEHVTVVPENELMASDGKAVYTKDGTVMLALAVPVADYDVMDGCKALAKKAFSNFEGLRSATLPSALELIGDYAFSKTGITEFVAPASLKVIGERAFFACADLTDVTLDQGLLYIGSNAFTNTNIRELRVPASIVELGNPIAAGTDLTYSGANASFSIDEGEGQTLSLDEHGALYLKDEEGMHLIRFIEPNATDYALREDTVTIADEAFAKHPSIERIVLNEGLARIGKGAFKGAKRLRSANVPSTVELIDDEAFLDTSLESLRIPASVKRIGSIALVTKGAHSGSEEPSLRHIEVEDDNPRYAVEGGLLIEHLDSGKDRIILCTGEVEDVVVPDSVTAIASYAFNGVRRLRSLDIHDGIVAIDVRGLAFDSLLDELEVRLGEPIEGRDRFEFEFPKTSRAAQQMRLVFGSPSYVNVEAIFDGYDNSIVSRTGFGGAEETERLDLHEQARRIVDRLRDPLFMSNTNKGLMDSVLKSHIEEFCVDIAKHDDKDAIAGLLELGYIDADNIGDIIEAVGAVQDASITNYLLEQKQRRFGATDLDFEL